MSHNPFLTEETSPQQMIVFIQGTNSHGMGAQAWVGQKLVTSNILQFLLLSKMSPHEACST
jgi:hypothetical protein